MNRHGIKKDANPQVVLNQLYRFTQLQDTVGVIMLALDDGVPKIMSLKTMMERYIEFQMQVIRRRTAFELKKAKEREHILEGACTRPLTSLMRSSRRSAPARAALPRRGRPSWTTSALTSCRRTPLSSCNWAVWPVWRSSKSSRSWAKLREAIADSEDILAND